jgi:hypothetical protein
MNPLRITVRIVRFRKCGERRRPMRRALVMVGLALVIPLFSLPPAGATPSYNRQSRFRAFRSSKQLASRKSRASGSTRLGSGRPIS